MNQKDPTRVIVIMAGGSGERFWPLSRKQRPKQLLNLSGSDRTLLQEAVDRAAAVVDLDNIYIQTGETLQEPIRQAGLGLPAENVLAEPARRNTAGCLIYAATMLLARHQCAPEQLTMGVLTADHVMTPADKVKTTVQAALHAAEERNALVVVGIPPTHPDTGFGYIETREGADSTGDILPVAQFREKPDRETAEDFVRQGRFFWNSGMFFWRVDAFLNELQAASPGLFRTAQDLLAAAQHNDHDAIHERFAALDSISIDYALMEKAQNVVMARADFHWDDIGTWAAIARNFPADDQGNVHVGDPVVIDSNDCIVYNAAGADTMAVATLGVRDLVVVVERDAVLVLPKDRVQDVRRIVAELKERNASQL